MTVAALAMVAITPDMSLANIWHLNMKVLCTRNVLSKNVEVGERGRDTPRKERIPTSLGTRLWDTEPRQKSDKPALYKKLVATLFATLNSGSLVRPNH